MASDCRSPTPASAAPEHNGNLDPAAQAIHAASPPGHEMNVVDMHALIIANVEVLFPLTSQPFNSIPPLNQHGKRYQIITYRIPPDQAWCAAVIHGTHRKVFAKATHPESAVKAISHLLDVTSQVMGEYVSSGVVASERGIAFRQKRFFAEQQEAGRVTGMVVKAPQGEVVLVEEDSEAER